MAAYCTVLVQPIAAQPHPVPSTVLATRSGLCEVRYWHRVVYYAFALRCGTEIGYAATRLYK
eukprot:3080175-Rhodomonas_salina.1